MKINNNSTTTSKLAVMASTSNTSLIGKNSDASLAYGIGVVGGGGGDDEDEVQSEYKGGPLDTLNALEEVLPFKKCISNLYPGKSTSFSNISNVASCPTIEDIRQPENAYTRKCKNLLAPSSYGDNNEGITSRGTNDETSKRTAYSRSMLLFGETENSSESTSGETSCSNSSSPGCCRPPLPPHGRMAIPNEQSTNPKYSG